jgi:hypothetical protein
LEISSLEAHTQIHLSVFGRLACTLPTPLAAVQAARILIIETTTDKRKTFEPDNTLHHRPPQNKIIAKTGLRVSNKKQKKEREPQKEKCPKPIKQPSSQSSSP